MLLHAAQRPAPLTRCARPRPRHASASHVAHLPLPQNKLVRLVQVVLLRVADALALVALGVAWVGGVEAGPGTGQQQAQEESSALLRHGGWVGARRMRCGARHINLIYTNLGLIGFFPWERLTGPVHDAHVARLGARPGAHPARGRGRRIEDGQGEAAGPQRTHSLYSHQAAGNALAQQRGCSNGMHHKQEPKKGRLSAAEGRGGPRGGVRT